ncbi:hypothetical protein HO133_006081 [Letharia lupina]|uniref:Uncharacterized protein n=1 Tax=Letharia lupina TaxID=560253 RepID=A0A8H6C7C5_9LECA|nr:uncharacterized protein HO133_006081 [Letharia lupina]KAF6218123.1 hypothetical protein HO133_006081 [Letharia lupina]
MFSDTWDGIVSLGDSTSGFPPRDWNLESPTSVEPWILKPSQNPNGSPTTPISTSSTRTKPASGPPSRVDDNYHTSREDEATFASLLLGPGSNRPPVSNILQHLVDALLPVPYISQLDASLSVKVEPAFDIDDDEADGEEGSDEGAERQDEEEERKMSVANERATELVLEAGVLDLLERLENSGLGKMVRELKGVVEGKFVARRGPT